MVHTSTKSVIVLSANSVTVVKPYFSPPVWAYSIICEEVFNIDAGCALQVAVEGIKKFFGLDELVPTRLDFGVPRRLGLPASGVTPSSLQQKAVLQNAVAASQKILLQIKFEIIRARSGIDIMDIHKTLLSG